MPVPVPPGGAARSGLLHACGFRPPAAI